MRTNIDLDSNILKEAFRYSSASTKKELVHLALREFIENHKRKDIRLIRGTIKLNPRYHYKSLRENN